MQSSPEVNRTYIKNRIIEKLYDEGKLDDHQKNKSLDELDGEFIPISRHFILKCLNSFLKTPNEELLQIYKEHEREERKKENELKKIRIVKGKGCLNNVYEEDSHTHSIPNGPTACAIDLVD